VDYESRVNFTALNDSLHSSVAQSPSMRRQDMQLLHRQQVSRNYLRKVIIGSLSYTLTTIYFTVCLYLP